MKNFKEQIAQKLKIIENLIEEEIDKEQIKRKRRIYKRNLEMKCDTKRI